MKITQVLILSAASLAIAQPRSHVHRHGARDGSFIGTPVNVAGRDVVQVTEVVPGPVVTLFEMNGVILDSAEVEQGLKDGKYVIIGGQLSPVAQTPSSTSAPSTSSHAPTSSSVPTSTASSSDDSTTSEKAAVKIVDAAAALTVGSSSSSTSTTPVASSTTPVATVASSPTSSASSSSSSSSSSSGCDTEFPSGTIKCSEFPSDYGAVSLSHLGMNGWAGIQYTPEYSTSASSIATISTGVSGDDCTENSFCSYACPAGYQKSQWPSAQGSTGQSIGGLYCNADGYLELANSNYTTICTAGAGNVFVSSSLSEDVPICRTDYPGTESETIPTLISAGASSVALTNPKSANYFTWEGLYTTAQYYINPKGATVATGCIWGSSGTDLGNWAPVNLGVGLAITGITYLSLFQNSPTNTDGSLDYTITIKGDGSDNLSGECSYSKGTYYSNGVVSSTGCTVAFSTGNAYIELS